MISITEPGDWLADPRRFHGEWQGGAHGAGICVIANRIDGPGGGPKLHTHPYAEVFVIREGRALFTLGDARVEASAGQILVAPAGRTNSRILAPARLNRSTFTRTARSRQTGWSSVLDAERACRPPQAAGQAQAIADVEGHQHEVG